MQRTCTCGNHINNNGDPISPRKTINYDHDLDASFVHLPYPPPAAPSSTSSPSKLPLHDSTLFNHGLLRSHQYMSSLLTVTEENLHFEAQGNKCDGNNDDVEHKHNIICLCHDCIQRCVVITLFKLFS